MTAFQPFKSNDFVASHTEEDSMQYDPSAMQNHPSAHVGFSKI